jgi:hypothetical protein
MSRATPTKADRHHPIDSIAKSKMLGSTLTLPAQLSAPLHFVHKLRHRAELHPLLLPRSLLQCIGPRAPIVACTEEHHQLPSS